MAKPAQLCKLVKGKLIDACPGFVDTFNYIVDWVENFRGEGEDSGSSENSEGASDLRLDRTIPDHPVMRGGGTGSGSSTPAKRLKSGSDSNLVFTMSGPDDTELAIDVYYV